MRTNLKLLRVKYGFTQAQMAMRLGISRTAYINIEKGRSKGSIDFWLGVKRAFSEEDIEELAKVEGIPKCETDGA